MATQTTFDDMRPTPAGVDPYEAKSALQKAIRRGHEEDALYWAAQLATWNAKSLWNRLKVIASEDVGVASPSAAIMVRALFENQNEATHEGDELKNGYLYIRHAVLVLVRSKKSRIADHATILAFDGALAARDVPDYALDKHTTRGGPNGMGRGAKHFFEVGAKLENCTLEDPYEARAKELCIRKERRA